MEPVLRDMPCIRCGYNLRGLLLSGCCPECGEHASLSQSGRHFAVADARWRKRLRLGAGLHAAGLVAFFLGLLASAMGITRQYVALSDFLLAVIICGGAAGTWLAVSSEPGGPYYDDDPWLRRALRAVSVVSWGGMGSNGIIQAIAWVAAHPIQGMPLWRMIIGVPAIVGSFLATGLLMWHLAHVARRMEARRLVLFGRLSAFATPITAVVLLGVTYALRRAHVIGSANTILVMTCCGGMLLWPAGYTLAWRRHAGRALQVAQP